MNPASPVPPEAAHERARKGVFYGMSAYLLWGFFPFYFSLYQDVPAWEIVLHRILWACVFLVLLISILRRWRTMRDIFRVRSYLGRAFACAVLIALNWGIYVYAIETRHSLQGSLGYFLTPLVNVALGACFLRERLSAPQWLAIAIAAAAIVMQTVWMNEMPWLAIGLAATFGLYGLIRKQLALDALSGLFLETALLTPAALSVFVWQCLNHTSHFGANWQSTALFLASGVLTAIPLLLFAAASQRLRLSTLGFLLYINPSIQFCFALFYFGEPLHTPQLVSFACIWVALALYSFCALRAAR
ncbi:MAG: EamA family transporter RarD [Rhodocyclaceae bacterium]|nr:EamA family transporter RarD [Rhodocyclaceae bacterium]